METRTTVHIRTFLYLDKIEQYVHENEKGLPFYVEQIQYTGGGDFVSIGGPAKIKTGERGYVSRSARVRLDDLDPRFRSAIVGDRDRAIRAISIHSE